MGAHHGPEEQRSSRHRQQQTSSNGMYVLFPLSRLLPGRSLPPPPPIPLNHVTTACLNSVLLSLSFPPEQGEDGLTSSKENPHPK